MNRPAVIVFELHLDPTPLTAGHLNTESCVSTIDQNLQHLPHKLATLLTSLLLNLSKIGLGVRIIPGFQSLDHLLG
jgi:hypothetical protein